MIDTATRTMTPWTIDVNHSGIGFAVKHMKFTTVRGRFEDYAGTIHFDFDNVLESSVELTIQTASINTNIPARDNHLRSADFFDVEHYPVATFRSTSIEGTLEDFQLVGELTIKEITRPVILKVAYQGEGIDPSGDVVVGFEATGLINRADFGLTWNQALESGGVLVSNEIRLSFDVQARAA